MRMLLPISLLLASCTMLFTLANEGPAGRTRPAASSQPASQPDRAATQPTAPAVRRVHVFLSGRVQGVGFRDFTVASGVRLRVTGWVRNLSDGRVELLAEGPGDRIEKLLAAVRVGPRSARVTKVEVTDEKPTGEFRNFARR